ncbi:MAG: hypothetical protein JNN01_07390 [Opitutaceae bacterium]|nr:hypothetical protein [Opitutaceae bacterium]
MDTFGQRHGVGIHAGFYNFAKEHIDPNHLRRISHVQNLHLGLIREGRILGVLRELKLRSLRLNQIFDLSAVRDLLG